MVSFFGRMWRAAPLATVVLVVALLASGVFAARTVAFWIYWSDPAHHQQAIEGWMPPGYIARSWQVPPEVVTGALDLPTGRAGRPQPLDEIARERGVPVETLIAQARAAIDAWRAAHPEAQGPRP